jgi:hypothetical protein
MNKGDKREVQSATEQYIELDVYRAMIATSLLRPDMGASITVIDEESLPDFEMLKVKITFKSVGRNLFTQRLTQFIILSMRNLHKYARIDHELAAAEQ